MKKILLLLICMSFVLIGCDCNEQPYYNTRCIITYRLHYFDTAVVHVDTVYIHSNRKNVNNFIRMVEVRNKRHNGQYLYIHGHGEHVTVPNGCAIELINCKVDKDNYENK